MKRVILVALALILLVSTVSAAAAQAPTTVSVGNYTVAVDETITIPVNIANGVNVYAGDVRVQYDPALVAGVSVTGGTFLNPCFVVRQSFWPPPYYAWYAATQCNPTPPANGNGTFINVTFKGVKAGSGPLTLINVQLVDRNGTLLAAVPINGTLTVVAPTVKAPTAIRLRSFSAH